MSTLTIDCHYVVPQLAAAYLVTEGREAAFIETNTSHAVPRLLAALDSTAARAEDVRWVIVTHAHLDHSAGASALMAKCPNATLLCHPRAARNLIDPAKLISSAIRVYGEENFNKLYGGIAPIPSERVREMADGETVTLGTHTLRFLHTAGHAKHHFVIHDEQDESVYTGDAFGLIYPLLQRARRLAFPSTSPIDFDAPEALKAINRIEALKPKTVYPTHFGGFQDVEVIASQLRRWIEVCGRAVEDAIRSGQPDEHAIRALLDAEMRRASDAAGLTLTTEDLALLEFDQKLNAQGLAVAASRAIADRARVES